MSHRTTHVAMVISALLAPLFVCVASARASVLFHDGFEVPSIGVDGGDIETLTSKDTLWTQITTGGTLNGLLDPNSTLDYYTGTTGETPNPIPNMDGVQIAFVFNTGGASAETFSHTLTDDLILGDTYTLGISVGFRKNTGVGTLGYSLELLANGVVLDSVSSNGSDLTRDSFKRISFSYTPVATDPIGQPLEIRFGTTQSSGLSATEFDDVELDAQAPEPASASLLAAASCALLARRRRRARGVC